MKVTLRVVGTCAVGALVVILPMVLVGKTAEGAAPCAANCTLCEALRPEFVASATQMTVLCVALLLLSALAVFCVYREFLDYAKGILAMHVVLTCVAITAASVCTRFLPACMSVEFAGASFLTSGVFLLIFLCVLYALFRPSDTETPSFSLPTDFNKPEDEEGLMNE